MNLRDAARLLAKGYPGGIEALAPRLGKSASTLRHELAGAPGYKLGAQDLEDMTLCAMEVRQHESLVALEAFAGNCRQMLVPLPESLQGSGDDALVQLGQAAKDFGELCHEVSDDLAKDRISDNAMKRIDADCARLIADLHAMRTALLQRGSGKVSQEAA